MDCYSAESEFIESLDFLSPPVKRGHHSREAFGGAYHNEANNVHLLRGLRNKFARRAPSTVKPTRTIKTNAESSTSLILKKTSERQILEQYSIVSYTSLQHPENDTCARIKPDKNQSSAEKPLIKVTVIPKTDQIQTAKLLRKRRYIPKRVQSTSSNHENSVQTKNVYLIVAGRRREKIYEIKTTGSAKLSTDHDSYSKDEDIPIKELSNFRHLIQSLNMDRKKKKEKKQAQGNPDAPQQTSLEWGGYPECEDCMCVKCSHDTPAKSRVKIFGQFGISEDDQYVLRYGASVNDKTVLSDVAQLTRDFSPVIATTSYSTPDDHSEQQKNSVKQVTTEKEVQIMKTSDTNKIPSHESQGTQVNFNVQVAMTKGRCATFSDKKIQCNCTVVNKSDHNPLKDCQSPLVIISVYPKPSPEDIMDSYHSGNSPTESIQDTTPTYTSNQIIKIDKLAKTSTVETKRTKSPSISRSPSPVKKASRHKMQEDKTVKTQVSEKKSPDSQKALKAIKEKILEKDKLRNESNSRKTSKYNTSNATQVTKNQQNLTISNATQVSKNQKPYTNSNATQVSNKTRQNFTVSNATQYSDVPQSLTNASNGTQLIDESVQNFVPDNHSKYVNAASMYSQNRSALMKQPITQVSNATQVPKVPHFFASNGTQVSRNNNMTVSNSTQVSKNRQNFIATRMSKNQGTATYTVNSGPTLVRKKEPSSKVIPTRTINDKGTNTDHARTKKAIVESYTKKLTEQMNQENYIPTRFDTSKVTINIDADKEYYDVLFNQDKLSTDVTVRKTLKEMGSQKYNEECSASLENMFLPECVEKGIYAAGNRSPEKSFSLAINNKQSDDEPPLAHHVSRLTIRDSLELSHRILSEHHLQVLNRASKVRREDKSNHNNIKNTQTCFTAQLADNVPDETEFLAPIKHFTGDDCSICNPIERDKQIRELLGVDKTKLTYAKLKQARKCENDVPFPYQCIYRQECKKSQVTEINFEFQKLCPCLKKHRENPVQYASVSAQCKSSQNDKTSFPKTSFIQPQTYFGGYDNNKVKLPYDTGGKCIITPVSLKNVEQNVGYNDTNEEEDKQKGFDNENNAIYQQLVLNRNIQVFLQVDQFSKQKPIVLSRKQYDKVKKTIQKTIQSKGSNDKRKKMVIYKSERSQVSVGEVRRKRPKDILLFYEKAAQTDIYFGNLQNKKEKKKHHVTKPAKDTVSQDLSAQSRYRVIEEIQNDVNVGNKVLKMEIDSTSRHRGRKQKRKENHKAVPSSDHFSERENASSAREESKRKKQKHKDTKEGHKSKCPNYCYAECHVKPDPERKVQYSREQFSDVSSHEQRQERDPSSEKYVDSSQNVRSVKSFGEKESSKISAQKKDTEVKTFVLFNNENSKGHKDVKREDHEHDAYTRRTMSSVEIRYASVAYMKHVPYSSTDVGAHSDSSIAHENSFHTIFRGHRKQATPNLGTSAFSLYSEDVYNNKSTKFIMEPRDSKPKKPFLRRLMSCLVMRSTRDSELKIPTGPAPELPSVNSSIDSYHISTSLGAVEVSSSIYDTSASFYSNHTILPVNSKIKRGFFSSVRGFLTNRKS